MLTTGNGFLTLMSINAVFLTYAQGRTSLQESFNLISLFMNGKAKEAPALEKANGHEGKMADGIASVFRFTWIFITVQLTVFAGASGTTWAEGLGFSFNQDAHQGGQVEVTVVDEMTGLPIPDAQISLAEAVGGTLLNKNLSLSELKVPALSVVKAGYTSVCIIGFRSNRVTVAMKRWRMGAPEVLTTGKLDGWRPAFLTPDQINREGDSMVYSGVVIRSLGIFDLLSTHENSVISPLRDVINVYGERKIPSNVVLPEQDVFLPIGTVHLDKPIYRLPVLAGRPYRLMSMQIQARVNDLMSYATGAKPGMEALNKVQVTKIGLSSVMNSTTTTEKDLSMSLELGSKHQVTVNRPPFVSDVVAVALTDLTGTRETLLPTDFKTAIEAARPDQVKKVNLNAPSSSIGQSRMVVALAMEKNTARRLSGIIVDGVGRTVAPGEFMSTLPINDFNQTPDSIRVTANPQSLSTVVLQGTGEPNPSWIVYVTPSAGSVDLPLNQLMGQEALGQLSVYDLEFGAGFDENHLDGNTVLRQLKRFTRSTAFLSKKPLQPPLL